MSVCEIEREQLSMRGRELFRSPSEEGKSTLHLIDRGKQQERERERDRLSDKRPFPSSPSPTREEGGKKTLSIVSMIE